MRNKFDEADGKDACNMERIGMSLSRLGPILRFLGDFGYGIRPTERRHGEFSLTKAAFCWDTRLWKGREVHGKRVHRVANLVTQSGLVPTGTAHSRVAIGLGHRAS